MTMDQNEMRPRPNIVLVHGAWADGSSWSSVIERLQTDGYRARAGPYRYHPYAYLHENAAPADLVDEVRGNTPAETLRNVTQLIPDRFRYEPGATTADTTTPEFVALLSR